MRRPDVFAADDARASMPEKQPGRHRWIVTVVYTITGHQASAMHDGSRVVLGQENMLPPPLIGCIDCEQPYQLVKGEPCPAEPYNWKDGRS